MTDKYALVDRYFDESLSADESAELAQWLQADPENARYFAERAELHAGLWRSLRRQADSQTSAAPQESTLKQREPETRLRYPKQTYLAALAACVLLALGLWWIWPTSPKPPVADENSRQQERDGDTDEPQAPSVQLTADWQITPTGKASFRIVEPTLVRLDGGELLVESKSNGTGGAPGASLQIETPYGEAVATGTRFYVGAHAPKATEESVMLKPLMRVLVLSGVVTLATTMGKVEGQSGDLLAAEAGAEPTKLAVQANSDFAVDLYGQLSQENQGKNLFFSPYSISTALAMTAEGARGETADQMGQVLRFPAAARRVGKDAQLIPWQTSLLHTGMAGLHERFSSKNDTPELAKARAQLAELRKKLAESKKRIAKIRNFGERNKAVLAEQALAKEINEKAAKIDQYEIAVANSLWGEKTYPFRQGFLKTVNRYFKTGAVFPVDFKNNYDAERQRINAWVAGHTRDRIQDLLPEGSLDEYTRLVLTNAIYFKGDWAKPFEKSKTKESPFTLADGKKKNVPLMHAQSLSVARYGAFNADASFFDTPRSTSPERLPGKRKQKPQAKYPGPDGFSMVELPYKGDELSMVVIAPNKADGLATIESQLTSGNLSRWFGQLKQRKTHVYLPKFKLETEYKLGDADSPGTLQQMGMVRAFKDPRDAKTGAQFQGMTTSTDPMEQLYISKVFHKAFVEVNEKGTEAAAATAVVMAVPTSGRIDTPFTPEFRADRPFIFAIRDKVTGSILFLGRMNDPTAG